MKFSIRVVASLFLAVAVSGCAMPPSSGQVSNAQPAARAPQSNVALAQAPLNHRQVDAILHDNKPIAAASKLLVGKPVAVKYLQANPTSTPRKNSFASIHASLESPMTVYVCSDWDKYIEREGYVNATVVSVAADGNFLNEVKLSGCTRGTIPPVDPSVVPMKSKEIEAVLRASKNYEKATRELAEKFAELKVTKRETTSTSAWSFQASKPQSGRSKVVYSCLKYDKSFKVGASVYGTLESVDEDDGYSAVYLSNCRTVR